MTDTENTAAQEGHQLSNNALLIALAVFVIIAAAMYYVGLSQGRKELATQQTHYEQQIEQGEQALTKNKAELASVRNRNHLMHARVALYRTAVDLDQRNFGIASGRLHEAADALGKIKKGTDGIDLEKVSELKESIETSDFTVAADLESQRANVLRFAKQLDAIATP